MTLPVSVSGPLNAAQAILANSSASPSGALPSLLAASSAALGIVTKADTTIAAFNAAAPGGSVSIFQFTNGLAAWRDALAARAQASQAASLANSAIHTIQNGF